MSASPALVVLATCLVAACGSKPTGEMKGRGVLVIAVDALRADHVTSFGYDRATTPTLDSLAEQGVAFTRAWSAAPELIPSHAAILSGCDPRLARRPNVRVTGPESERASWYLPDALPRLPQQFLAQGFQTAAFFDDASLDQTHGFAKGFQECHGSRGEISPAEEGGFERVASKFLNWLNTNPTGHSWFAYVHVGDLDRAWQRAVVDPRWETFFEPRPALSQVPPVADGEHVFFAVPRGRWSGGTFSLGEYEARYDAALRQLDQRLARMLEAMRQRGWLENTTIAIVGTYGFSLGESGLFVDSGTLSDVDLRVPLIVRPSLRFEGRRGAQSEVLASVLDLAPTLLALHALPIPPTMQGVSLVPALHGESAPAHRYVFASGGVQRGTLVVDERFCLETSYPGAALDQATVRSWFGDSVDHLSEARVFLHDRSTSRSLGHLEGGLTCEAAIARLSEAGERWFAGVDEARTLLHPTFTERRDDPGAVLDLLRKRGLLGPPSN